MSEDKLNNKIFLKVWRVALLGGAIMLINSDHCIFGGLLLGLFCGSMD